MKHITRLLALMLAMTMLVGCLAACGDSKSSTISISDAATEDTLPADTATGDGQATQPGVTEIAPETSTSDSTTILPPTESTAPGESTSGTSATQAPGQPVQSQPPMSQVTTTAPTMSKPISTGTQTAGTTTTTQTTTTVSSKHVMTYTTYATTTEVATTTKAPKNPLRVLSIGHSFSKDAMEKYLWDLLNSSGKYDYIVIAYLFYPGCPLDGQWDRINSNKDPQTGAVLEYQQYRKTDPYTGAWQTMYKPDNYKNMAEFAIKDEKWDIITLQPSPDYGAGPEKCNGKNDYTKVGNILNWISSRKTNPNAKVMYHMTWAFAEDCRLWSFQFSHNNQMEMYTDFVAATKKYIFDAHPGKFAGIIPAGTSIQNARSSKLGDVFNMPGNFDPDGDGYHLNDRGDFVAALTWYCVLTGNNAKKAKCPDEWKSEFDIFVEAVNAAIKKPYAVTKSSYKK